MFLAGYQAITTHARAKSTTGLWPKGASVMVMLQNGLLFHSARSIAPGAGACQADLTLGGAGGKMRLVQAPFV